MLGVRRIDYNILLKEFLKKWKVKIGRKALKWEVIGEGSDPHRSIKYIIKPLYLKKNDFGTQTDQWNAMENSEGEGKKYGNLIYDKEGEKWKC